MRNDKLRRVFEALGFANVGSVISSGNILFDSESLDAEALEARIEDELPKRLGFTSTTIIRSREQLQRLVDADPFKGMEHSDKTHLNVTFLKRQPSAMPKLDGGQGYEIVATYAREVCSVVNLTAARTPELMIQLERKLGKEITTRTYKTVERILKKLNQAQS
jgi:uncharacterized protein (DUF1697 family)